jgi:hypothetical protein
LIPDSRYAASGMTQVLLHVLDAIRSAAKVRRASSASMKPLRRTHLRQEPVNRPREHIGPRRKIARGSGNFVRNLIDFSRSL